MHHGPPFNVMVQVYFNPQNDQHCHQLCLQRTFQVDEVKYWKSAESEELTTIRVEMTRTVHLKLFQTPKVGIDRNEDLDHSNDSEGNWQANNESIIEPDNCIADAETPQQGDVSTAPNVPRLIPPTWKSIEETKQVLMMVDTMERRRNQGIKIT